MENPHRFVSYEEARRLTLMLAKRIEAADAVPNQLITVFHGGFYVADLLRRRWKVPMAFSVMQSYTDENRKRKDADIVFPRELVNNASSWGRRPLLVDDLVDSGLTFEETLKWLDAEYGDRFTEISTAVLFWKTCSTVDPDFHVEKIGPVDEDRVYPWIDFEWERPLSDG